MSKTTSTIKSVESSTPNETNFGQIIISISLIFVGCIANNFTLELLMKEDSGIGNLLTLLQFVVVAFVAFFLCFDFSKLELAPRKIPIQYYLLITCVFFLLSVINNKAFDFEISQPVHMVFRSSSLITSLLLGLIIFGSRYSRDQIIGVFLVSIGITVVTFAEGARKISRTECTSCEAKVHIPEESFLDTLKWENLSHLAVWFMGLAMLTFALICSSLLGHIQDYTFRTFKASWRESLFFTHLIGIVYFAFFLKDIQYHLQIANTSAPFQLLPGYSVPILWVYIGMNCVTQVVCILGVYALTAAAGTLSCTLTLTVRKFVSLVLSILYFKNPFTIYHWMGGALVFVGTAMYSLAKKAPPKDKKD